VADIVEVDVAGAGRAFGGAAALLDVREPEEFEAGHAPGALHLPLGELSRRLTELPGAPGFVVVCRSGSRSALATEWLRAAGIEAANLVGGMQAWAEAGRDVVTDDGRPGRVI